MVRAFLPQSFPNSLITNTNDPPQRGSPGIPFPPIIDDETFDNTNDGQGTITFDNATQGTGNVTVVVSAGPPPGLMLFESATNMIFENNNRMEFE